MDSAATKQVEKDVEKVDESDSKKEVEPVSGKDDNVDVANGVQNQSSADRSLVTEKPVPRSLGLLDMPQEILNVIYDLVYPRVDGILHIRSRRLWVRAYFDSHMTGDAQKPYPGEKAASFIVCKRLFETAARAYVQNQEFDADYVRFCAEGEESILKRFITSICYDFRPYDDPDLPQSWADLARLQKLQLTLHPTTFRTTGPRYVWDVVHSDDELTSTALYQALRKIRGLQVFRLTADEKVFEKFPQKDCVWKANVKRFEELLKPEVTLAREPSCATEESTESRNEDKIVHTAQVVPQQDRTSASERDPRALVAQRILHQANPVMIGPKVLAAAVRELSDVDTLTAVLTHPRAAVDALREMGRQQFDSVTQGTSPDVQQTSASNTEYHGQASQTMDDKRSQPSTVLGSGVQNVVAIQPQLPDVGHTPLHTTCRKLLRESEVGENKIVEGKESPDYVPTRPSYKPTKTTSELAKLYGKHITHRPSTLAEALHLQRPKMAAESSPSIAEVAAVILFLILAAMASH